MSDTATAAASCIRPRLIHVGTPPANGLESLQNQQLVVSALIAFHRFDSLPPLMRRSDQFTAFGREWRVGIRKNDNSTIFAGIGASASNGEPIEPIRVRLEVGQWHPERASTLKSTVVTWGGPGFRQVAWQNFANRSDLELVDGALILKASIYMDQPSENAQSGSESEFVPANPCLLNVLKEYGNEETSDVTIEVGGVAEETGTGRRKRAKRARTDSTAFHAHQFVLQCNAPTLAEMCKPGNEPVRIANVSPETFKHLLYYCYGGKISDEDLEENAKEIIDAADRFGVANLKLEAEAYLVQQETFTVENILDNLLYADSKNCALLLEKAMDFVVDKKDEIIGKISLDDLPGSMVMDVLTAISRAQRKGKSGNDDDIDFMRVSELRKRLHAKGLCVDGSRKAMIALLKENSS